MWFVHGKWHTVKCLNLLTFSQLAQTLMFQTFVRLLLLKVCITVTSIKKTWRISFCSATTAFTKHICEILLVCCVGEEGAETIQWKRMKGSPQTNISRHHVFHFISIKGRVWSLAHEMVHFFCRLSKRRGTKTLQRPRRETRGTHSTRISCPKVSSPQPTSSAPSSSCTSSRWTRTWARCRSRSVAWSWTSWSTCLDFLLRVLLLKLMFRTLMHMSKMCNATKTNSFVSEKWENAGALIVWSHICLGRLCEAGFRTTWRISKATSQNCQKPNVSRMIYKDELCDSFSHFELRDTVPVQIISSLEIDKCAKHRNVNRTHKKFDSACARRNNVVRIWALSIPKELSIKGNRIRLHVRQHKLL